MAKQKYEFDPPVSQWETDHLVFIANDETLFWEEDAMRQARDELNRRGVAPEYEQSVLADTDKNDAFGERLLELGEAEMKANADEEYTTGEKIAILVCAPLILTNWSGSAIFQVGNSLSELKSFGCKVKYRTRAKLLILGVVMWAALVSLAYMIGSSAEKQGIRHNSDIIRIDPRNPDWGQF
jgi:hypothetical protein